MAGMLRGTGNHPWLHTQESPRPDTADAAPDAALPGSPPATHWSSFRIPMCLFVRKSRKGMLQMA